MSVCVRVQECVFTTLNFPTVLVSKFTNFILITVTLINVILIEVSYGLYHV
jgi:hypothetical protein